MLGINTQSIPTQKDFAIRCSWDGWSTHTHELTVVGRASQWLPGTAAPHSQGQGPWRSTSQRYLHTAHRAKLGCHAGGNWGLTAETCNKFIPLFSTQVWVTLWPLKPATQFSQSCGNIVSVCVQHGHFINWTHFILNSHYLTILTIQVSVHMMQYLVYKSRL